MNGKVLTLLAVSAVVLGWGLSHSPLFSQSPPAKSDVPKIGVANFEKVLAKSKAVQKAHQWLIRAGKDLEGKIRIRRREIANLQKKLKVLNSKSELYETLQWKLKMKAVELKTFTRYSKNKLKQKHRRRVAKAVEEVQKKILAYARKRGYTILLNLPANYTPGQVNQHIFYHEHTIDLTDALIQKFK